MTAPRLLTGGEAVAHAFRQIAPDVVPVYPITPQTPIIQAFSSMVAAGDVGTAIVNVESEHSAMSAAIGSALSGARTVTATSSQGLALMAEVVFIAASMRAPIVMAVGNRALSGPINIHCDHSDAMLVRDSGVVQLFAENAQEAYDLTLVATRVAEAPAVSLPVLVCQDGFTITHAAEPVTLLDDEQVEAFVGPYTLGHSLLDTAHPATFGPFAMPDYYFELRRAQAAALESALSVFQFAAADLARLTGRTLAPASPYRLEDARTAVVALGSTCGTIKDAVDDLRASGVDAGLLQIRSFRPFPTQHARALLAAVPEVVVLDRADSPGGAPPLAAEIAYALRGTGTEVRSYVYGLGGRDLHPAEIADAVVAGTSRYLGLRGLACPA